MVNLRRFVQHFQSLLANVIDTPQIDFILRLLLSTSIVRGVQRVSEDLTFTVLASVEFLESTLPNARIADCEERR